MDQLEHFLKSRDHRRPYTGSRKNLAAKSGVNASVIYEASWGCYKNIPPRLQRWIPQDHNEEFRLESRQALHDLELDWPNPWKGFAALADFWDTSLQAVARAMCLQRPVVQSYDRKPSLLYEDINLAIVICAPPNYFEKSFVPYSQARLVTPSTSPKFKFSLKSKVQAGFST